MHSLSPKHHQGGNYIYWGHHWGQTCALNSQVPNYLPKVNFRTEITNVCPYINACPPAGTKL